MSARNHSEPPKDETAGNPLPVLQPEVKKHGMPEVVWSSPVSTGSGFGAVSGNTAARVEAAEDEAPAWSNRYIYAFESDLLDNALVHWEHDELTLEMIPGFKKDPTAESDFAYPVETVASGLGDLIADGTDGPILRLDKSWTDPALAEGMAQPFQPDVSAAVSGPMRVRDDGIEDPVAGWRPTGMVFFETLSTPPRGTVYSSSILDSFMENRPIAGSQPPPLPSPDVNSGNTSEAPPFFDFPETVAPAPPEETEDFPLSEIVVKGGGGGSGGVRLVRFMGKMFLLLLALFGLGMLALFGSYGWYIKHRLYDNETRGSAVTMIVKPGDSFRSIIDSMHKEGLLGSFLGLDDRYLMRYLAYAFENSDKVKPGVYRFSTGQNLTDVYDNLIAGSKDFKLTIPEGSTAKEVAAIVAKQYKNFDDERFIELVHDPAFIKSVGIDAPSLEGYLYPSTYYFGPGMKEEELVKLMVSTFQGKVETLLGDKATTASGLSFQEHVIMASLIEREARLDEDRPLIASVIFNRLEQGIPLQIDATVNYALNDWRRLTNEDYKTDHPYNTYKIKGLPPGPIASPRIESLAATFDPPDTNYLYYVHKGDGHHAFAETYAQHQANVGRYIREKNASGMGNTPSPEALVAGESAEANARALQRASEAEARNSASANTDKAPALAGDAPEATAGGKQAGNEDAGLEEEVLDIKIEAPAPEPEAGEEAEESAPSESDTDASPALAKPKSY